MKLLLHTCCGPCFLGVWEELGAHKDIETTLYYFNPNIWPRDEYNLRLENLKKIVVGNSKDVIFEKYDENEYLEVIMEWNTLHAVILGRKPGTQSKKKENEVGSWLATRNDKEKRCQACYRLRLGKTAKFAKANGYDAFSTTLLVSPYQQHDELRRIGEEVGAQVGVDFYYTDWRPYFREGQNEAKTLGIYRQRYCGCKYSKQEAGK